MNIYLTNLNHSRKIKPVKPKSGGLVFCLLSVFLLLCLLISPVSAAVEWDISPSNPTVGDTLKIKGTASPGESLTAEVSFEKEVPVSGGRYEYSLENIKVPGGNDNRFTVRADRVQNLDVNVKKLIWIKLHSEASKGVATISQANVPSLTYDILINGDALNKKSSVTLKLRLLRHSRLTQKGNLNTVMTPLQCQQANSI